MADLDQEIADLKEVIKGYEAEYKTASAEDKRLLLQTIMSRTETLNKLLDQKAQSGGNSLRHLMRRELYILAVVISRSNWSVNMLHSTSFSPLNLF